jgi:hypothetical protein
MLIKHLTGVFYVLTGVNPLRVPLRDLAKMSKRKAPAETTGDNPNAAIVDALLGNTPAAIFLRIPISFV